MSSCEGVPFYLAYVYDTNIGTPPLKLVRLISEFIDMFLTELSGVPPNRDIEFGIDLNLGTKSISIHPYRMTLVYLNELKN